MLVQQVGCMNRMVLRRCAATDAVAQTASKLSKMNIPGKKFACKVGRYGNWCLTRITNEPSGFKGIRNGALWRKFYPYLRKEILFHPSEMSLAMQGWSNVLKSLRTFKFAEKTVGETAVNVCIGLEILMFFFLGEVIGRGHLSGYSIEGMSSWHAH